jgi:hypothetical protein
LRQGRSNRSSIDAFHWNRLPGLTGMSKQDTKQGNVVIYAEMP